jgi:hypothetical protein
MKLLFNARLNSRQHKNGQQVTVENINSAVDQIGKLYDDTAKSTLGVLGIYQFGHVYRLLFWYTLG